MKRQEFQHTATRRWLQVPFCAAQLLMEFQHTATRRWLHYAMQHWKAFLDSFNTQPPEGGCRKERD